MALLPFREQYPMTAVPLHRYELAQGPQSPLLLRNRDQTIRTASSVESSSPSCGTTPLPFAELALAAAFGALPFSLSVSLA
jgi:hypothetical protein